MDFSFFIAVIKDLVYKSVDECLPVFGFGIIEVFEPFDIVT